jgi:hypothetical protein
MNGAADLGGYGTWRPDPMYGNVWAPTGMPVGWAPYRYGHWAYIPPWGWTWVDDAPWGFAPFHYGRWVMAGGGWAWVPGRLGPRPVYAPALVAFVGGPGFGIGIGFGVGGFAAWIPLGPFEVFHPAYRVSAVYVTNINVAHVTNVNVTSGAFVNRSFVTAVPSAAFVGARPVAGAAVRVPAEAIGRIQPANVSTFRPTGAALAGSVVAPGARVGAPPAAIANRGIVARTPLPAGSPAASSVHLAAGAGARPAVTNTPGNTPGRSAINDRPPTARQGQTGTPASGQPAAGSAAQPNRPAATPSQPAAQAHPAPATPQRAAPVQQRTPPKTSEKKPPAEKKP